MFKKKRGGTYQIYHTCIVQSTFFLFTILYGYFLSFFLFIEHCLLSTYYMLGYEGNKVSEIDMIPPVTKPTV